MSRSQAKAQIKENFRDQGRRYGLLSSEEAQGLYAWENPLRKVTAGVTFRGRWLGEPLPETTPNMAEMRGRHFVTRLVCVLIHKRWRVLAKLLCYMM